MSEKVYLNTKDWCGYCQKKPDLVINTFSNISMRHTETKCRDCGSVLEIRRWNRNLREASDAKG